MGRMMPWDPMRRYEGTPSSAVMTPVPNKPKTPMRSFRISDEVYRAAQERAAERGESLTDVVRRALERYGKTKKESKADLDARMRKAASEMRGSKS